MQATSLVWRNNIMTSQLRSKRLTEAPASTYTEYFAFVDTVIKAAQEEHKLLCVDRYNQQIGHIRHAIGAAVTTATAVCTVVTFTPFWNVEKASLMGATWWHMILFAFSFLLSAAAFAYGIYALRGENSGTVLPLCDSFIDLADLAYGADGQYKALEAKTAMLSSLEENINEWRSRMNTKGIKIRRLNAMLIGAIVCAALPTFALFSQTIIDNGRIYGRIESANSAQTANTAAKSTSDSAAAKHENSLSTSGVKSSEVP